MAYIGNTPALQYISHAKQTFTADSSTVAFSLDNSVANENELEVFVNNVRQEPGSGKAYTASGTTLTMSAAPTTGDDFYCIYQGRATQTVTPGSGTVTNDMMGETVSIAKGGTGATTLAGAGLTMVPAFSAYLNSAQTGIADSTTTAILFDSEDFDSDSAYTTSNGRFTVPTGQGGKYYFWGQVRTNSSGTMSRMNVSLQKNGSTTLSQWNANQTSGGEASAGCGWTGTLAAGDYVRVLLYQDSGSSVNAESGNGKCIFYGFKLIGA